MERIKDTTFYFDEQEIAHSLVKEENIYTKQQIVNSFLKYCNNENCIDVNNINKDGIRAFESTIDKDNQKEVFRIIIHENNFDTNKNEIFKLNEIVDRTKYKLNSIPEDNVSKLNYDRHMDEFKKLMITVGIVGAGLATILVGKHILDKYNLKSPIDILIDIDNKKFDEETKESQEYYQKLQDQKDYEDSLEMSGKSL